MKLHRKMTRYEAIASIDKLLVDYDRAFAAWRKKRDSGNLYERHPLLAPHSGSFWRCRHEHTSFDPCWRCGLRHPIRWIRHLQWSAGDE